MAVPKDSASTGADVPMPTLPLLRMVMAVVPPLLPTLNCMLALVAVLAELALLPSKVSVPLAETEPIKRGTVADVVKVGVASVGLPENTKFVFVVPVVPVAALR